MSNIQIADLSLEGLMPLAEDELSQVNGGLATTIIYLAQDRTLVGYDVILDGKDDVIIEYLPR